jgi:hypothetical protein
MAELNVVIQLLTSNLGMHHPLLERCNRSSDLTIMGQQGNTQCRKLLLQQTSEARERLLASFRMPYRNSRQQMVPELNFNCQQVTFICG